MIPITNDLIDLVGRVSNIFDIVIVTIVINLKNAPILSLQKRVNLARHTFMDRLMLPYVILMVYWLKWPDIKMPILSL